MTVAIDMGTTTAGVSATMDLEELLATRLLVQGNSGSGKSHLLRRLIEQSAPWVQQVVVDPEGDFVTLADNFGHVVVDASAHSEGGLQQIAGRVRTHRISVVLNLENLDTERQMRHTAAFLGGLFDIDRAHWYPALVVVDEAQLFAPAAAGEVSDDARKLSLGAMTNLMCRGRKRGLAGIIATQRLAKLAKNVAAEASNFLMGRTFLDIDMARAADLLGMERRQAEMFRDLERGHFIALGPAVARRPLKIRIGSVETSGRGGGPALLPLPQTAPDNARDLIMKAGGDAPRFQMPKAASTTDILCQLAAAPPPQPRPQPVPPPVSCQAETEAPPDHSFSSDAEAETPPPSIEQILREVVADPECAGRSIAVLYQDFLVRCRGYRVNGRMLDLANFKRKLAQTRADLHADMADSPEWDKAVALAQGLAEDIQGVFLMLARAALDGTACPSDGAIARARGSSSPRRARGLLTYLEGRGLIACHDDIYGNRIIALPGLGWETAPGHPEEDSAPHGDGDLFDVA